MARNFMADLIFTKLIDLVSMEQFHHKPVVILSHLQWYRFNITGYVNETALLWRWENAMPIHAIPSGPLKDPLNNIFFLSIYFYLL